MASVMKHARETLGVLAQLSKARLSALVVCTSAAGFVVGSGEEVDYRKMAWTSAGTFACAAAANTLNQVYEVRNDSLMQRTCRRPLPTGKISPRNALLWAAACGAFGCWTLAREANATTAALGAGNIALYAGVYTPLKQISMWNTWVGALVGAVPPVMGWTAAAGSPEPGSLVLASALHFWQLPHFLSLAWICKDDYAKGGYRMLSLLDKSGGRRTAACALRNAIYLLPIGFLAQHLNVADEEFTHQAAALSTALACSALVFFIDPSKNTARVLFGASLVHLPLFMGSLLMHRLPQRRGAASEVEVEEGAAQRRARDARRDTERRHRESPWLPDPLMMPPFPFLPLPGLEYSGGRSTEASTKAGGGDSGS